MLESTFHQNILHNKSTTISIFVMLEMNRWLHIYSVCGHCNLVGLAGETRIFQENWVDSMAADVLPPCVARSSAAILLLQIEVALNIWRRWIGQRQLQGETRNNQVLELVPLILEIWRYVENLKLTISFIVERITYIDYLMLFRIALQLLFYI